MNFDLIWLLKGNPVISPYIESIIASGLLFLRIPVFFSSAEEQGIQGPGLIVMLITKQKY
jgi:hypothetical protein